MVGSLSSLGLGSDGVLNAKLIDSLKNADSASIIKPIERKEQKLALQQSQLGRLKSAMSKLSDLSNALADPSLYTKTTSSVTGDSISVTTKDGIKAQNLSVEVENMATKDIQESSKFASRTDTLDAGSLHLEIDGNSYDIEITDSDTLETLSKKISKQTDGKIDASIMNVGGDKPYELILKSHESGEKNRITVSGDIDFTQVGDPAKDASIRVDGVKIQSSSNELKDVIQGVDIKILHQTSTKETITIKQDTQGLTDKIKDFIQTYNSIIDSVKTATNYNPDTKVAGIFSGSSEIKNMMAPLNNIFFSTISKDGKMSENFGIKADRHGKLTFDENKFTKLLKQDSTKVQEFFVGKGEKEGIFRKMDKKIFDIGIKSDGLLKSLKKNLEQRNKSLDKTLADAKKRLDNKYEILRKRFASFDSVIAKITAQSDRLSSLIKSQQPKNS